ncbi:hypothetical protein ACHAXM_002334 [Skeletonema potamos]
MTLPKLSLALSTLLLRTSNAAATPATTQTQDWYVASQAKSFFRQLAQNKEQNHRQLSSFFTTATATISETAAQQQQHEHQHRQLTNTHNVYTELNSSRQSRSFAKLQKHQPLDPNELLNQLSQYDKFWIEINTSTSQSSSASLSGACVWSECAVNDVDEEYTGDNRDGDEQWYQFRTQTFCANAAYALYGRKKGELWGNWEQCTGRHFINSFFTYGGADTLLKAVGKTPEVYYGGDSNADCVASNGYGDASYSTLGCAANGNFMIGFFDGNSCDGNYYVGGSDDFSKYNSVFKAVKCHEMSVVNDSTALSTLLSNSWACDVRTYGSRCPDPHQLKGYYEYALQTAAAGGNPMRAYNQLRWKDQLRLFSWVLMGLSFLILFAAFSIKQCAVKKRPDGLPVSSSFTDDESPNASAMTVGKTRIELEDGGKLKNVMETVSSKTLFVAGWFQSKFGRGEKEKERTFQASSPDKQDADDAAVGYKNPNPKSYSQIDMTRSTTPSTARKINATESDDISLEMAPTSLSYEVGKAEDHDVKAPRQSLQ